MVEDLWDTIVGEHGQLMDSSTWEYGMGYLVRSRWSGEECGPCFCYQDLGSFEEIYCKANASDSGRLVKITRPTRSTSVGRDVSE